MRFIHAGDFHLDSAFGALSPEKAMERRQEGREAVAQLAQYVNANAIDLVLLAGDLFDANKPFSQTGGALRAAFGQMKAQVVIAPGNHDFCGGTSPYLTEDWPENVHIFTKNTMETVVFPQWNMTVSGAGFVTQDQGEGLLTGWSVPQDGRVHLGVLHGEVQATQPRYNPITREDIAQSGLHYLALGHIHKRTEPVREGGTLWAFSGCLEGHGFDELGQKGFYQGDVGADGTVNVTFVPFPGRRHEWIEVDVTGKNPLVAVEEAVPADAQRHLYRIVFTGETDGDGVELKPLYQALSGRFYHLELRDKTTLTQDVWARAGEDSLGGLFLKELQSQLALATTEQDRQAIVLAARYGLAALENREML